MGTVSKIELYDDWEVFLCSDVSKNNCKFINKIGNIRSDYWNYGENNKIAYMLVQPKNHATINRFYGHKEYNEKGNGADGYVELYYNRDLTGRREVLIKKKNAGININIGNDTIIKPEQVKGIRIIGGLGVEVNFNATAELEDYYDIPNGSLNYTKNCEI